MQIEHADVRIPPLSVDFQSEFLGVNETKRERERAPLKRIAHGVI